MKIKHVLTCLFSISLFYSAISAELVSINIISEDYIQITFDDGDIIYFDMLGQDNNDDISDLNPLNITDAENIMNYFISSSDDPDYATPQNPTSVGRLTKGHKFSGLETSFPISYRHQIFLKLNNKLEAGKKYNIQLSGSIDDGGVHSFSFDPFEQVSEAVHINQIGSRPEPGLKIGYVGMYLGSLGGLELDSLSNTPFHLVDTNTNNIEFTGTLNYRYDFQTDPAQNAYGHNYYGADVWECDFSSFNVPGNYKLVVEKFGSSLPFDIGDDVYDDIFFDVARSMYHQRCGVSLDDTHTEHTRPLCHHPDLASYTPTYSEVKQMYFGEPAFNELVENDTGVPMPHAFKRYHDAADWDSTADHLKVAYYLNLLFELKPDNFKDGQLNIPESGNGIPDILDESKWAMNAFRFLKGPTGGICGGVEESTHPGFGDVSYQDELPWFTYAEEPRASFMTAAALSQYAHQMNMINESDSIATYISEAETLYVWGKNNKVAGDDPILFEEEILAAAMLYRITGQDVYQQDYKILFDKINEMVTYPENATTLHMALFTYAKTDHVNIDQSYIDAAVGDLLKHVAFTSSNPCQDKAFRYANNPYRPTRFGGSTTPFTYQLIFAYELTGEQQYLDWASTTNDYFLGGNMLNMCWVTGHGHKHPEEILHLDSWVDGIPNMIPGYSIYGNRSPAFNFGWHTNDGHGYTGVFPSEIPAELSYFENRYCPSTAEFTIHETLAPYAFSLGYFTGKQIDTGIDKNEMKITDCGFNVFPNPSENYIQVDGLSEGQTIQLLDGGGQVYQTINAFAGDQRIETSGLPGGMFLVKVIDERTRVSRVCKVVK